MKFLKNLWNRWLKIGKIIGNFQAQVIFTVFYFLLLLPIGIAIRFFSDPLNLKAPNKNSNFDIWEYRDEGLEGARRPY